MSEGAYYDENGEACEEQQAVRHVYSPLGYTVEDIRATPQHDWISWNRYLLLSDAESAWIHMQWAMYKSGKAPNSQYYAELAKGYNPDEDDEE